MAIYWIDPAGDDASERTQRPGVARPVQTVEQSVRARLREELLERYPYLRINVSHDDCHGAPSAGGLSSETQGESSPQGRRR
jgi:hypothetical protein